MMWIAKSPWWWRRLLTLTWMGLTPRGHVHGSWTGNRITPSIIISFLCWRWTLLLFWSPWAYTLVPGVPWVPVLTHILVIGWGRVPHLACRLEVWHDGLLTVLPTLTAPNLLGKGIRALPMGIRWVMTHLFHGSRVIHCLGWHIMKLSLFHHTDVILTYREKH